MEDSRHHFDYVHLAWAVSMEVFRGVGDATADVSNEAGVDFPFQRGVSPSCPFGFIQA